MDLQTKLQRICARKGWTMLAEMVEIQLDGGRTQRVWQQPFDHEGDDMVRFFSVVGNANALTETRLKAALSLNFRLPHGALALSESELVLVDTFLLRDADEGELEASLSSLANTADTYEKLIYQTDKH